MSSIAQAVSCIDGYDPDALRVDKAGDAIRACLVPVRETETVAIRDAWEGCWRRISCRGSTFRDTTTRRWMATPFVFWI